MSAAGGESMTPTKLDAAAALQNMDTAAPSFDFGADEQTNALLLQDAQTFITGNMARIMAAKHAHDLCANNRNGTWGKWCNVVGISRDTGDNMVHIAEQFGNIQIDGQSIFDVRPMKLLYAAAKSSAPAELVQKVKDGEITTHKAYQDLLKENQQLRADRVNAMNRAERAESRAHDAETRLKSSCIAEQNAQEALQAAESARDAALADVNGLKKRLDAAEAREEEVWKMHDKAEARAKAAEDSLKRQPIATVVDEEEVDRRAHQQAYGIAADMTDELRTKNNQLGQENAALQKQLEEARAANSYDPEADMDTVCSCLKSIDNFWEMAFPALERLNSKESHATSDYAKAVANTILRDVARVESEREQRHSKEVKA